MKANRLLDAIGNISDTYVYEAAQFDTPQKKRTLTPKIILLRVLPAAVLCAVLTFTIWAAASSDFRGTLSKVFGDLTVHIRPEIKSKDDDSVLVKETAHITNMVKAHPMGETLRGYIEANPGEAYPWGPGIQYLLKFASFDQASEFFGVRICPNTFLEQEAELMTIDAQLIVHQEKPQNTGNLWYPEDSPVFADAYAIISSGYWADGGTLLLQISIFYGSEDGNYAWTRAILEYDESCLEEYISPVNGVQALIYSDPNSDTYDKNALGYAFFTINDVEYVINLFRRFPVEQPVDTLKAIIDGYEP